MAVTRTRKVAPTDLEDYEDEAVAAPEEDDEETPRPRKNTASRKSAPAPEPEDDDDDDAEPAPRRGRRAPVEDDEEDQPVRRGRARRAEPEDDDDDYDDEDEDEEPELEGLVQAGWDAARDAAASIPKSYTEDFRAETDEQLVKFISDAPIIFRQHWIDEHEGKKSFPCLTKPADFKANNFDACPLCDSLGDTPDIKFLYEIVNLSAEGFETMAWTVGPRLQEQIEDLHKDKRKGPITKYFWAVKKVGSKSRANTTFELVKPESLHEWDLNPEEVADELGNVKSQGTSIVRFETKKALREVVEDVEKPKKRRRRR
jgi:hypothetical protein